MLTYPIGLSGQFLHFSDDVLSHFNKYRQGRPWRREAGGQLFARFTSSEIHVDVATGPRATDKRGRSYYHPDREAEREEILLQHSRGFHYLGDWHTHPSVHPDASWTDLRNIADCVLRSKHDLAAFVMVIVGTVPAPEGLRVSLHDGESEYILLPETSFD